MCLFFCGRKLSEDQNLWIYFHSCGGGTEQDVIQSYLNVKHAITRLNIPSVFLVQILKSIVTLTHFVALGEIYVVKTKVRWSKVSIILATDCFCAFHDGVYLPYLLCVAFRIEVLICCHPKGDCLRSIPWYLWHHVMYHDKN